VRGAAELAFERLLADPLEVARGMEPGIPSSVVNEA
jgi:hypothetical protein